MKDHDSSVIVGDANEALARYQNRLAEIDQDIDSLKRADATYGFWRVGLFFLFLVALLIWGFSEIGLPAGLFAFFVFAAFFVAVVMNEPIRDKLDQLARFRAVVSRLIARIERDWEKLATKKITEKLETVQLPEHRQAVADDLDLLGSASLFHLVSMTATMPGIRTLAQWLAGDAKANEAQERTAAIAALAPLREERIRFYSLTRDVGEMTGDPDSFVDWAVGEPWLQSRGWLLAWANLSAVISVVAVAAVVLGVFGLLSATAVKYAGIGLIGIAGFNFLLTSIMLGPAHQIFSIAMSNRQAVSNYQELFQAAEWLPSTNDDQSCLARIRAAILSEERSAQKGMRQLQRVASAGGLRQSASTFLLYLPLQAYGLWDVRVLKRLEDWQAEYGNDVPKWFDALGELESLMSLAALRDEYPGWTNPTWITDDAPRSVSANSIGHPLLLDRTRVCNDVSIGPPGTVLLVTGSNMSGKSTMLRSVGLNIALAGTGAPVCAREFSLPSIELATSIRVRDNLSEGVSFYMAELQRLKGVVDQAREAADSPDRVVLFLLDEILQGTNSRERQIAVVHVLKHLMDSNAIGAITTHDLELADEPKLMSVATPVHFRETIRPDAQGEEQMTFDYKMRQGVSPTTNALRLLEMVGLGSVED